MKIDSCNILIISAIIRPRCYLLRLLQPFLLILLMWHTLRERRKAAKNIFPVDKPFWLKKCDNKNDRKESSIIKEVKSKFSIRFKQNWKINVEKRKRFDNTTSTSYFLNTFCVILLFSFLLQFFFSSLKIIQDERRKMYISYPFSEHFSFCNTEIW